MGQHVHLLQGFNEFLRVVALVGTQRECRFIVMRLAHIVDHGLGRFAFGVPIGLRDHGADDQPVAVLHERVAHEAQLAGGLALAVQTGIGVCAAGVGLVAAPLVSEVAAVAAVAAVPAEPAAAWQV